MLYIQILGEGRQALFTAYVCSSQEVPATPRACAKCDSRDAILRCLDCTSYPPAGGVILCASCDEEEHPYAHFHKREHSMNGSWRALPANLQHDAVKEESVGSRTFYLSL